MRQTTLLFSLLTVLAQPLAAQALLYNFDFDAANPPSENTNAESNDMDAFRAKVDSPWQESREVVERDVVPGAELPALSEDNEAGNDPHDYAFQATNDDTNLSSPQAIQTDSDSTPSIYTTFSSAPYASDSSPTTNEIILGSPQNAATQYVNPVPQGERLANLRPRRQRRPGAAYGPFRILNETTAAMVGGTDERTPAAFSAMLRDHPGIATLELVDCPGTEDDRANLRLGRMIRAHGIATHVPNNGWVASGAVEIFLAGVRRLVEPRAEFAVHSWEDDTGRGPNDFSPEAPENRDYIDYYRAMGMSESNAKAFYAMTNSTPFSRPRHLSASQMAQWSKLEGVTTPYAPAQGRSCYRETC